MRKPKKKHNYIADLESGCYYHVYNRTNNKERLFKNEAEKIFFLKQYKRYLRKYVETFTYALMGTHFHLLIKVKSIEEIENHIKKIRVQEQTSAQKSFLKQLPSQKLVKDVLANQFNRFFNSYSKTFNLKWNRQGNLFNRPFKRIKIDSAEHFTRLIYYHHLNCRKHKIFHDFKNYKWSSYQALISDKPTELNREMVLEWFGGKQRFLDFHNTEQDLIEIQDLIIEDDSSQT